MEGTGEAHMYMYNSLKTKQQMCGLLIHVIHCALCVQYWYCSRAEYHMETENDFPSEHTLRDYSHWCTT